MLIDYTLGQTSIILRVKILNSSVTTGAGLTGLTSASSGLIISTIADNEASATTYTVAGSTIDTITTIGTFAAPTATHCRFKEVDSTNHKGVYEIQIADARFAVSSAKSLLVSVVGATNAAECDAVIPLRSVNPYDGVHGGMSALPNVASGSAGAIPTTGTGSNQISVSSGQVILQAGTGPGQLDFTSGVVKSNATQFAGQTITCGAGVTIYPAVGSANELAVDVSGRVDIGKALGTAVTLDANNVLNVSAKYWAGTAIVASSIPVATAAGASGGLFIAGTNDNLTITNNLSVGGTTILTGAMTWSGGLTVQNGISVATGGVIVSGGVTFQNSAGTAFVCQSAGGNGHGAQFKGQGSGDGIETIGGATGRGQHNSGGSSTMEGVFNESQVAGYAGMRCLSAGTVSDIIGSFTMGSLTVSGATTLTGAVTATNASNDIQVDAVKWATQAIPTPNQTGVPLVDNNYWLGVLIANPLASTADVATANWQDRTAGDFTVSGSIGMSLFTSGNAPGAASGLATVGSKMDLVNAPNATAVTAIQAGLATPTNITAGTITTVGSVTNPVAVTSNIKKNQALTGFRFVMTNLLGNPQTGLTVTCTRDIGDGNGFVTGTLANVVEIAHGEYSVDFGAGDLNGKVVMLRGTAALANDTLERVVTQP